MNEEKTVNEGWKCPVCGQVFAPWVNKCDTCGFKVTIRYYPYYPQYPPWNIEPYYHTTTGTTNVY